MYVKENVVYGKYTVYMLYCMDCVRLFYFFFVKNASFAYDIEDALRLYLYVCMLRADRFVCYAEFSFPLSLRRPCTAFLLLLILRFFFVN